MGSLNKSYSREKLLGKVYTPGFIVEKMLDDAGYNSPDILGRQILDPACGDGQFLAEVVRRIIKYSPPDALASNLACVHGWDIDAAAVTECIQNLNRTLESSGVVVEWNIRQADSLKKHRRPDLFALEGNREQFDFIVGNPPYIRIQHLDEAQRLYIQENYDCCQSGSTDIYIAFYELCLNLLAPGGLCVLITPNTFLFTETAREMRRLFAGKITHITNYGDIQLFEKISTYSAIVHFGKQDRKADACFRYERATGLRQFETSSMENRALSGETWRLGLGGETPKNGVRLGDICKIHVGLTTLCDKVYIFPVKEEHGETALVSTKHRGLVRIEKGILRPIVKASRLKDAGQPIRERILFPYIIKEGKHVLMPEEMLSGRYPLAYEYLSSMREMLDRRDNGKPNPVAWYAFGRTQGLDTTWGAKILFSPISVKPNFIYHPNADCAFYSGYCIKYNGDISKLLEQLNSDRMEKFMAVSSRDFRGGWKAYNKKTLENFEVEI